MEDMQRHLKAACALVRGAAAVGTGYLVAPDLVATCAHVIPNAPQGQTVTLQFGFPPPPLVRTARVERADPEADCALLLLDEPLTDRAPLELGVGSASRLAPWFTFGYPEVAKADGTNFAGVVDDPDGRKEGRPAIVLTSEKIAAGMASPIHGLSGSPVVVGRAVIGHIASIRPDSDFPQRAAFGEVYASPIGGVIQLLEGMGRHPLIAEPTTPEELRSGPPALGDRAYHAFVSYRSTDRLFALDLVERLEARGFNLYIDQRELLPGDELAASLQEAIAASRAALVLVSKKWLESPWCRKEMSVLLHQAIESGTRVIAVRLDECELPPMLASTVWIDFAGVARAEGTQLERIVAGLAGPPVAAPRPAELAAVTAPATPFSRIEAGGRDLAESTLTSAQALISIGEPRAAVELLQNAGDGTRARQLRALGLAKSGRRQEAIAQLEPLVASGQIDAETGGILGGRYKELWLEQKDAAWLYKSFRVYRMAFERSGDLYPGVNVLALAVYLERDAPALLSPRDQEQLATIAAAVRAKGEEINEDDPDNWRLATRAEVLLLHRDLDGARRFYALAACAKPEARQEIAVMRRQARRNLKYLGLAEDAVDDALQIPSVAAFTGHMTDAPDRPKPRLPEAKVAALRLTIRGVLERHRVGFGFSSGARGSDILFAEEVLARGGRVKLFLPFPVEVFRKTSVETAGDPRWVARFDDLLACAKKDPRIEVVLLEDQAPPEPERPRAYAACNLAIQNAAIEKAQLLDQQPRLIAVWDGNPAESAGGAADAIRDWRDRGMVDVDVINPTEF